MSGKEVGGPMLGQFFKHGLLKSSREGLFIADVQEVLLVGVCVEV